ncbi:NADH:flavin oxidoreductase/NADH oxidase [Corynebacterium sp.]|uniref:NADH:flavin oxidoreductase/NADH oxidase n=1 Tax=Corynebacterium sp. TaxID=1720 RepID=UPI0026DEA6E7|nr:NADH:flavin oxidoreductase/NADH oxidase [Corynebacterium sp.]MDO5511525.1 NADH:flavin oxidoreductase/NADH oxidase [Corynebacterium sp.]
MNPLFTPVRLRDLEVRNRIWLPPMCQYHATDGMPEDWHLVHYGARAAGGFGLIIAEASGVVPEGRISPACTGLWNDEQAAAWARIVSFVHAQGAAMAIQLNHAGRKASTAPWLPGAQQGTLIDDGWPTVAPSPVPQEGLDVPRAMSEAEIEALPGLFAAAAIRAVRAGFDTVEIHGAHGYLLHQFLTPLANHRTDDWGGSFDNRTRLLRAVVRSVRQVLPEGMPLLVRLSATDWIEGAWDLEQSVRLVSLLIDDGVDLIDVSTGGAAQAVIPVGPGYQVEFAEEIKRRTGMPTAAVGMITEPEQAASILEQGRADAVLIGRAGLRDASWPLRAAQENEIPYPDSYWRATPRR